MSTPRVLSLFLLAAALAAAPSPCAAQLGKLLEKGRVLMDQANTVLEDARGLGCDLRGACGNVDKAAHFAPRSYESVAVTVFDGTSSYDSRGSQGMVRDEFERKLVGNGFLLAANSDAARIREMIAKGDGNWTDQQLQQLREFVQGIDAIVVVEIRKLDTAPCRGSSAQNGRDSEATVHLSVRWLNVDAGDIPWVATHKAAACEGDYDAARTAALQAASSQLAGILPNRRGT